MLPRALSRPSCPALHAMHNHQPKPQAAADTMAPRSPAIHKSLAYLL